MLFHAIIILFGLLLSLPALADLTGRASVIDGNTIEIHGQRIRLFGIDAPESQQLCQAGGESYLCGQQAALALSAHIAARPVTCARRDIDRYGRVLAVCSAADDDLNACMARQGWALAYRQYSTAYVADEEAAHVAGVGIWGGTLEAPWDWRRDRRKPVAANQNAPPAANCQIKGNTSSSGERIYHARASHKLKMHSQNIRRARNSIICSRALGALPTRAKAKQGRHKQFTKT
jgi:endonuclease YncB( thermonuclease family)